MAFFDWVFKILNFRNPYEDDLPEIVYEDTVEPEVEEYVDEVWFENIEPTSAKFDKTPLPFKIRLKANKMARRIYMYRSSKKMFYTYNKVEYEIDAPSMSAAMLNFSVDQIEEVVKPYAKTR